MHSTGGEVLFIYCKLEQEASLSVRLKTVTYSDQIIKWKHYLSQYAQPHFFGS